MDNSDVLQCVYTRADNSGFVDRVLSMPASDPRADAALLEMTLNKMLSSWKEIAHFFGKGVRTVQRWEKTLNLPIRRPPGAPSNVVLARTSDLEAWMHRGLGKAAMEETSVEADSSELVSELEAEVHALIRRTGGNVPAPISMDEASVPKRLRVMIDAVRATDAAHNTEHHPLRKVA